MPVKAAAIALTSGATVEEAFRIIVRAALTQIEANVAGVRNSRDLEFVHQMRVGMRRFRSSLIAFSAAIPQRASEPIRLELREAASALGNARDWDVLSHRIAAIRRTRFPERDSLEELMHHVVRRRAAAVRRARNVIEAADVAGALQRADRWLKHAPWRGIVAADGLASPVTPLARKSLKQLLRKALKCGADAAALHADARHRLRVRIKRLRYACEFFVALYPRKRTKAFIERLQQLQETLGALNDIAVGRRLLGAAAALPPSSCPAAARIHQRAAQRERGLLSELDAQWKRLRSTDPYW